MNGIECLKYTSINISYTFTLYFYANMQLMHTKYNLLYIMLITTVTFLTWDKTRVIMPSLIHFFIIQSTKFQHFYAPVTFKCLGLRVFNDVYQEKRLRRTHYSV